MIDAKPRTRAALLVRLALSIAVAITVMLATVTYGCVDVGGVPSWERCKSALGNPIIEWPGDLANNLIPLALGVGAGWLTWKLLDRPEPAARAGGILIVIATAITWILVLA